MVFTEFNILKVNFVTNNLIKHDQNTVLNNNNNNVHNVHICKMSLIIIKSHTYRLWRNLAGISGPRPRSLTRLLLGAAAAAGNGNIRR